MSKATRASSDTTIYRMIRAMAGIETGRNCRTCGEPIERRDRFGMSEGVCSACRMPAAS